MRYLKVKNFERFQHYKSKVEDAAPTWIKLYRTLLVDYDFQKLNDVSKGHLILIWLFASQTKGRIPDDSKWIAEKIGATSKVDLGALIEAGFLILECLSETTLERFSDDSQNHSMPEERRGEEIRGEEKRDRPSDSPLNGASPATDEIKSISAEDLMQGWNDLCAPHGLAKIALLSETRKRKAAARAREHDDIAFWNRVFARIKSSAFLLGRTNNGNGHEKWRASFDWLIENDTNCVKVYEGKYNV